MRNTIYLETGSADPYYNLAFEEFILCNRPEGDYLLLWQNHNTVVVGRNQNTEAEINRAFRTAAPYKRRAAHDRRRCGIS